MKKLRVAIYCRVANHDQLALTVQKQAMHNFAEATGYEVSEVICDTGSGTSVERPGIRRLYELADAKAIDAVLASGTSRYARCMTQLMGFVGDMKGRSVEVLAAEIGSLTAALGDWEKMQNR